MDTYPCQKRRKSDPHPWHDFNQISALVRSPVEAAGSFLSVFILFVHDLFINITALETRWVPKVRDEGDNENIAA